MPLKDTGNGTGVFHAPVPSPRMFGCQTHRQHGSDPERTTFPSTFSSIPKIPPSNCNAPQICIECDSHYGHRVSGGDLPSF